MSLQKMMIIDASMYVAGRLDTLCISEKVIRGSLSIADGKSKGSKLQSKVREASLYGTKSRIQEMSSPSHAVHIADSELGLAPRCDMIQ